MSCLSNDLTLKERILICNVQLPAQIQMQTIKERRIYYPKVAHILFISVAFFLAYILYTNPISFMILRMYVRTCCMTLNCKSSPIHP